jgi:NAD(P) transhydrogenase subunit alpha
MKLAVLKEQQKNEHRVAATPETVKKLTKMGFGVSVEDNAGLLSGYSNTEYKAAGATITKGHSATVSGADIIVKVLPPFDGDKIESGFEKLKAGANLISLVDVYSHKKPIKALGQSGVNIFGMELIPRISRAQAMDVLSSQSNLAGYRAVIDGVGALSKATPMMMTAAGTVKPAKALILGAGVAGLQAIATAKRLGAVVSAFDVRPAVKEQVESLGATFVEVPNEETDAETKGGYAKEMSKDYQKKQEKLIFETIIEQDLVITTALIPGKPAPELISEKMLKEMKSGSVVVDLAVIAGGNCRASEIDKVVTKHGVKIVGYANMPSRVANDASQLFSRNVFNFIELLVDKEKKQLNIPMDDEIIQGCLVSHNGRIVHPLLKDATAAAKPESKKSTARPTTAKKTSGTTTKTPSTKRKAAPKKAPPKKIVSRKPHLKQKTKSAKPPKKGN